MDCPKCDGELEIQNTDSRQEWFEEEYVCSKCDKTFYREVVYKTQSSLIESDTLYDEKHDKMR